MEMPQPECLTGPLEGFDPTKERPSCISKDHGFGPRLFWASSRLSNSVASPPAQTGWSGRSSNWRRS